MGPQCLLSAALLLAQVEPREASQHCGRLEYWNPDNLCCGSCLQRFGPPRCPDYEFSENCGLNDFGDHVMYPFQKCPPGQCNPNSEELCSPCDGGARPPTAAGTGQRCLQAPWRHQRQVTQGRSLCFHSWAGSYQIWHRSPCLDSWMSWRCWRN
uniref:IGF like family receptor 1 n=1 Tax=Rousettus aegyptiacus TaxID=9407 RepID=A0A7J8CGW8_ROUAE|nr:IGF like family receptor 1 [Rousettus aegyptiacus]